MTPYLDFLTRLATASIVILPSLLATLAVTRWCPISPLSKVWILRIALLGSLVALVGIGIPVAVSSGSAKEAAIDLRWLSLAVGMYAAGVLTRGAEFVRGLQAVVRLRRHTAPAPLEVRRVANEVAATMGLRRSPPLRRANGGESVLLVAGRPATIVLPAQSIDEETLRLALAHEMAHVRHRDLLWSGAAALAQCVFWFHPGVHWVARRLGACQENAADRAALAGTDAPTRRYAEMLIGVATARRQVPLVGATAASIRDDVEERLRSLYAPRPTPWALPVALIAVVLTAVPLRPTPVTSAPKGRSIEVFSPVSVAAPVASMRK